MGDKKLAQVDLHGKPFHFIGIGGIGMSALAQIVARRQLPVSGSDLRSSHITDRLEALGIKIFYRQEASNLDYFTPICLAKTPSIISVSRRHRYSTRDRSY